MHSRASRSPKGPNGTRGSPGGVVKFIDKPVSPTAMARIRRGFLQEGAKVDWDPMNWGALHEHLRQNQYADCPLSAEKLPAEFLKMQPDLIKLFRDVFRRYDVPFERLQGFSASEGTDRGTVS